MGNSYTNCTLVTADQARVLDRLRAMKRHAYVTPGSPSGIVIFDKDEDVELGRPLSKALGCPALVVLDHDDDVLYYWLYENGKRIDSYCSHADFDEDYPAEEGAGDAAKLCRVFGKPKAEKKVKTALASHRGDYVFAVHRHHALVKALRLPECAVGMRYRYIASGDIPSGLTKADLTHVP
jgi:hypothetical protein